MAVGDAGSTTLGGRLVFGGVASGLDTNALVRTLMAVEARPLVRLQGQKQEAERDQQLYRDLNSKLLTLRNAARDLDNRTSTLSGGSVEEELLEFETTSSNQEVVTATATGDAVPGSYEVKVAQLARVGREFSTGQAARDSDLGLGGETLTVSYGGDADITVDLTAGMTLDGLRDAINADPDNQGNVQASVLYDGTDYHLVIAGTESGVDHDITVTESAGMAGFIDATAEQAAQDAIIEVLGFEVRRPSNQIDDALDGVTLNLRGLSADVPDPLGDPVDFSGVGVTEIEVNTDVEGVAEKLESFAKAYNDVRDFISEHSAFDAENVEAGPFAGDSTIRFVDGLIQNQLVQGFEFTDGGTFQSLAEIGVSLDTQGRLSVDRAKLEEALVSDVQSVKRVLGGDVAEDEDGVATALARALEPLTRSGDGLLATRIDGFDDRIESLDTRMDQLARFLEQREESLIRRFTSLETLMSQLQSQAGFLSAI